MVRDAPYVGRFLERFARSWRELPDQRFGQLVANVIARDLQGDLRNDADVATISDGEFLALLEVWDATIRRGREEAERSRREEAEREPDEKTRRLVEEVRRTQRAWDAWALKTYGRIGRDPARIGPFLDAFGRRWLERPETGFVPFVLAVVPQALPIAEDDVFLKLLSRPGALSGERLGEMKMRRGPPLFEGDPWH